jgi:RNA polymerase sigma-B factor
MQSATSKATYRSRRRACVDSVHRLPPLHLRSAGTPTTKRAEEQALFIRLQNEGDVSARAELVERFLPLARKLARRYERANEPVEDLVQVASLALLKAIDRFDATRGDAFSSYAVPTILGELKRYFRNSGWAVHVPRGLQERVLEVNNAMEELSRSLGRSPSIQQLSLRLHLSAEEVLEAMEAGDAYSTTSLDAPRRDNGSDEDPGTIADRLGAIDDRFDLIEETAGLDRGLKALPERERTILFLRFAEGLTQGEIAERIGISQMHVSRLIRRAVERVRVVSGAADA